MFSYLENPFMVCYNPGSPDQDTESHSGDCEAMQAVVPEPARVALTSTSYPDLTGCDLGYPVSTLIENSLISGCAQYPADVRHETRESCSARCPGTTGSSYCDLLAIFPYSGSRNCIDTFTAGLGLHDDTLWSRAFFEVSLNIFNICSNLFLT